MDATKNKINFGNYPDLLFESSENNNNATSVYGPFEKLYLSEWGQSEIHINLVKALNKMDIRQMMPIQKNSFLYLMNNYNTAMVGFSKGKSITYLTSIFSLIMNYTCDVKTKEIGPIAIVLTSSLRSCCILENLSKQLNYFAKIGNNTRVVVADASTPAHIVEASICNGCKILIATPTYLNNLLKKSKLFSWLNLRHFVFDNVDLLLQNYKDEIICFFQILKKMKDKTDNIQFISTSVRWTKDMDEFLKVLFVKWQYIFGSPLEAAHYMKIGFNVVHTKNDKLEKILQFLKRNIKYGRTVLITSNSDELCTISSYFQSDDSDIEVLLAKKLKSAIIYTIQDWNSSLKKNQRLLICSDDMLFDYNIFDADCLIHYDIPTEKHTFSIRFSVLQDSNLILTEKKRSSYIFLSDSSKDMLQLPKIVDVMKTFGNGEIDPILLNHVKLINDALEKEKINSFFCDKIQQFGSCPNQSRCKYRHVLLKEIDAPANNIPKSGLAIIQVLNIYDASHMSVKLLKLNHTNNLNDQNWLNVKDYSSNIKQELNSFYSNPNNKIILKKPKPGDIVTVEIDSKVEEVFNVEYCRATVMDSDDLSSVNNLEVKVKLIDEGFIDIVSIWKILVLPDKYKSIPTTTVDMYVLSVKPIDFDTAWSSKANTRVKKQFKSVENCSDTIIVKVKLALETTIWVNKIHRKFWNPKLRIYDFETIFPDLLLNFGFADLNSEHLHKLTELSTSVDIYQPLPLEENSKKKNKLSKEEFMSLYKLPEPQWAHLDRNVDDTISVDFIMSPKLFFVRNSKFLNCVSDLNMKIDNYIEQKQVDKLKHIVERTFCLAVYPITNRYCRVQICNIIDETLVEVLFVDIGDFLQISSNSLLTIHPNLISSLPFQLIECSLNGVKDTLPSDHKLDELSDFMFDLTQYLLYSKVINTSSSKFTGGKCYEVILYSENININLEMHAKYNQYFDLNEISNQLNSLSVNDNHMSEDSEYKNSKELFDQKLPFDINLFEDDDMDSEDLVACQELLEEFGQAIFGQDNYERMKKNPEPYIKNVKESPDYDIIKNISTEVTSSTLVTKEDPLKDFTVEPVEKIVPVDLTEPKIEFAQKETKPKKLFVKHQNLCLTCNNYIQSIVPQCIWYQNENHVFLKFSILEIDSFSLNCTPESIIFKAQFKDSSYNFCAKLFGLITDHNVTHKRSYEGFHIKAEKLYKTDYIWPRLFVCNKWHKYIKYDPEHIEPKRLSTWILEMNKLKMKALQKPLIEKDIRISDIDDSDYDLIDDSRIVDDLNTIEYTG